MVVHGIMEQDPGSILDFFGAQGNGQAGQTKASQHFIDLYFIAVMAFSVKCTLISV